LKHLVDTYTPRLTDEEQAFLDNEVETLCRMIDDYNIVNDGDLSPEVWEFIRKKGFCSIKIPKEWGGKGFSTQATSTILMKVKTSIKIFQDQRITYHGCFVYICI
jgi:acyl-CoA dehydrogenase